MLQDGHLQVKGDTTHGNKNILTDVCDPVV